MSNAIPFQPSTDIFEVNFFDKYASRLAIWLAGEDGKEFVAITSNSPWEAALTAEYLLDMMDVAGDVNERWFDDYRDQFLGKIKDAVKWMIGCARKPLRENRENKYGEEACWEDVLWDTAVVCRLLTRVLPIKEFQWADNDIKSITSVLRDAINWQLAIVDTWHTKRQFSFGSPDLAAFVSFATAIGRTNLKSELVECEFINTGTEKQLGRAVHDAVALILADAGRFPGETELPDTIDEGTACWWLDYFSTAEVVDALMDYVALGEEYNLLRSQKTQSSLQKLCGMTSVIVGNDWESECVDLRITILVSLTNIGYSQNDGMWGSHVDTLRILSVYAKADQYFSNYDLENRSQYGYYSDTAVVFKALRFVCDYHQWFDDGSYQHTIYLSVFCSQAFRAVLKSWRGRSELILTLYDVCLWDRKGADGNSVAIASLKLKLERERFSRTRDLSDSEERSQKYRARVVRLKVRQRQLVAGFLVCILTLLALKFFGVIDMSFTYAGKNAEISLSVGLASVVFTILIFLISIYSKDLE